MSIFSVFSVKMDFRDLLILLCNRQRIAYYEVYWLLGVSIINA